MNIFDKKYIRLNMEVSSKKDALKKISNFAKDLKIASNANDVYKALVAREEESTTGFQDGFAIPHARIDYILKPSILFISFKKGVDWQSLDGKLTKYVFVLLIPIKASNMHLDILSKLSTALLNTDFVANIISSKSVDKIYKEVLFYLDDKKNIEDLATFKELTQQKRIVALTACPVGVAHTYLAAEKLTKFANEKDIWIKVETHGSAGVKNQLTDQEIKSADAVIVASDIGLDLSRFNNKIVVQVGVKEAIHEPERLIEKAFKSKEIYKDLSMNKSNKFEDKKVKTSVMKHILAGISYMVPFVILGGICIALSAGIGKIIYGQSYNSPEGDFFYYLNWIGSISFTLMIGILGAYIANSIAGRSAIAPAFIVSVLGNTPEALYKISGLENSGVGMGFVGSILFGLLVGYTVKWINSWNLPKSLSSIMPIFVIPLGVGLFYGLITMFVIGGPIAFVMNEFINVLKGIFQSQDGNKLVSNEIGIGISILIGILLGAMAGFDMGGPINKVAFLTCTALISSKITEPMGMMAAAIPVAPLGMGLCTMIFRKKFSDEEKTMGVSAFIMGLIGISEGAIPFAISNPKKAIPCNVIGSAMAGAIAAGFGVTDAAAHGGPIVGVLGAIGSERSYGLAGGIGFFFLAIIVGTLITCFLYALVKDKKIKEFFKKKNSDKHKVDAENNVVKKDDK
ncbi:MAG: fructose-specific PTS transporter subunit EIIC, partial [Malacoplasma sp.]|nr:fructose-specific PTS transporter subunit EIIC [Malacoplasma sp.]